MERRSGEASAGAAGHGRSAGPRVSGVAHGRPLRYRLAATGRAEGRDGARRSGCVSGGRPGPNLKAPAGSAVPSPAPMPSHPSPRSLPGRSEAARRHGARGGEAGGGVCEAAGSPCPPPARTPGRAERRASGPAGARPPGRRSRTLRATASPFPRNAFRKPSADRGLKPTLIAVPALSGNRLPLLGSALPSRPQG